MLSRSVKLFIIVVLAVILALCSAQNVLAEITSASLTPTCGPPGTNGTLLIRYTGSHPTVQTNPDLGPLGGDVGEGVVGIYFTVPEGVHQITFTIFQDDVPARTVVFCPTSSPVGGVLEPVKQPHCLRALPGIVRGHGSRRNRCRETVEET